MGLKPQTTVLITRAAGDAIPLRDGVHRLGGRAICIPLLAGKLVPHPERFALFPSATWYVFTSKWAVDALDSPSFRNHLKTVNVAAVGPKTSEALADRGIPVVFTPRTYTSEALFRELPLKDGDIVIYPMGNLSSAGPIEQWVSCDIHLHTPVVYENAIPEHAFSQLSKAQPFDIVTLCSSSAAKRFHSWWIRQEHTARPVVIAIGPSTAATCVGLGLTVEAIAKPHNIAGLLDALRPYIRT